MKHLKLLLVIIGVMILANGPAAAAEYELHQAVLDNDLQLVKRLLSKGKAIDVIGSRKYGYGSALHLAVREGHVDIAQVLIDRGAQVDVLDPDDFTPLHNAAWNGNLEMTELLLAAGADINASTYDGDTPLKLAKSNDQVQIAKFIQAKLQAPSGVATKVESTTTGDSGVIDFSGTYISVVTGPYQGRLGLNGANPEVKLVQEGSKVTGTFEPGGKLWGDVNGDSIELDYFSHGYQGKVNWKVKPGGNEVVGTWTYKETIGKDGNWNLTRIETEPAPIPDISGTYIAETTASGSGATHNLISEFKKLNGKLIVLKQTGNTITGSPKSQSDWIPDARDIKGTREGNIINFYIVRGNEIIGTWEINADATKLEGKWFTNGAGGASGKLNLKRVK